MKTTIQITLVLALLTLKGCIEVYNPPEIQNNNSFLVVEGFLDAGNRSCTIRLSNTISLTNDEPPQPVIDASVLIEDENNNRYILNQQENGVYSSSNINVDPQVKYRLKINDGFNEYESSLVEVTTTPPIDSIEWRLEDGNVKVYVNTHNSNSGSRYYQWSFSETWEYNSAFRSFFRFTGNGIVRRDYPDEIYYCWKTDYSTKIKIGTSMALEQDVISDYLVHELKVDSRQFQTRYSIQVSQSSLTRDAYDFWSQVRDNTEASGSLFDVQPSRIRGNIYNVNGNIPVIGFFSASTIQQKRIFISSNELPPQQLDTGYGRCAEDSLLVADIPTFNGAKIVVAELIEIIDNGPRNPPIEIFLGYTVSTPFCVDCRVAGGTNSKPVFWDQITQNR